MYEFADHGGLTMLAPISKPSVNVSYSWNQGTNWFDCTFASSNIQVFPDRSFIFLLFLISIAFLFLSLAAFAFVYPFAYFTLAY